MKALDTTSKKFDMQHFRLQKEMNSAGTDLFVLNLLILKKGLVEITSVMEYKTFKGRYIPYYSDIDYRMIISAERLTEKVDY